MWNRLWIPIIIPTLINKSTGDNNQTNDVFIKYGGHADADYIRYSPTTKVVSSSIITTTESPTTTTSTTRRTTPVIIEEVTDGVMFVPNDKPVVRREDEEYEAGNIRVRDIMNIKTMHDAMDKDFLKEEEEQNGDVVFVTGKNYDLEAPKSEKIISGRRSYNDYHFEREEEKEVATPKPKLDCNNLDCNNTIKSICGGKYVEGNWKYRMFMNDCYFRKVNCGLKYEVNRYKPVSIRMCQRNGARLFERTFAFKPKQRSELPKPKTRRSSTSRRSMTTNFNGEFCSHPCPTSCPEDYDPQCAISATGRKRVFQNHCKLDYNSCFYSVVWHKRPLAECIGGKKADMRQNAGFIDWMQRVGIVDRKGRLVLS